jgi:phosphoenolpyruvate synthase/pyruvate phosphate dikinase
MREPEGAGEPSVGESRDKPMFLGDEVVWCKELRRDAVERAGGKGANLGELLAAGFPVLPGFCVTTAAYRRAVAEVGLVDALNEVLRDVQADDPGSAAAASVHVATLFEDLPLPADLVKSILDAYRVLGTPAAAVRSSATTEDLPAPALPASRRRH